MRSSCLKGFPFFSQRISGLGFPPVAHRNFTVLAAGTACSFFSIFSGEVQYGATAGKKKQFQTFASSKYQQEPHTCSALYIFLWCVEAFKITCSFDMHHIKPPCKLDNFFYLRLLSYLLSAVHRSAPDIYSVFSISMFMENLGSKPETVAFGLYSRWISLDCRVHWRWITKRVFYFRRSALVITNQFKIKVAIWPCATAKSNRDF